MALSRTRFEDGTGEVRYRVQGSNGKQYLLPEQLSELLEALNGQRTLTEVADVLRASSGLDLTPDQIRRIILREFVPRGLVESDDAPDVTDSEPTPARRSWRNFDFAVRIPLVSAERLRPVVQPLTVLFRPYLGVVLLLAILIVHLEMYGTALSRGSLSLSGGQTGQAYLLVLLTICMHELGHATACRRFDCEHGEVGFCLYLTLPALYVDLSACWRLTRRQRALIDVGGVYFQLISTLPLFLLFEVTKKPSYAAAVYTIDLMVLLAMNPLGKFDGYWLLVDASGLANLQRRALVLLKECLAFVACRHVPTILDSHLTRGRKVLLLCYTVIMAIGIITSIPFLVLSFPRQLSHLVGMLAHLPQVIFHNPKGTIAELVGISCSCFFFVFLFRFIGMLSAEVGTWLRTLVENLRCEQK